MGQSPEQGYRNEPNEDAANARNVLRGLLDRTDEPEEKSAYTNTLELVDATEEPPDNPLPFSSEQLEAASGYVKAKAKGVGDPNMLRHIGTAMAGIKREMPPPEPTIMSRVMRRRGVIATGAVLVAGAAGTIFAGPRIVEGVQRYVEPVPAGYDGILADKTVVWKRGESSAKDTYPESIQAIINSQKLRDWRMKLSDDAQVEIVDYADHLAGWLEPKAWAVAHALPERPSSGITVLDKTDPLSWHDNTARHFTAIIKVAIHNSSKNKNPADWKGVGIWLMYIPKKEEVLLPEGAAWDTPVFYSHAEWINTNIDTKTAGTTDTSPEDIGKYNVPPKKFIWAKHMPPHLHYPT